MIHFRLSVTCHANRRRSGLNDILVVRCWRSRCLTVSRLRSAAWRSSDLVFYHHFIIVCIRLGNKLIALLRFVRRWMIGFCLCCSLFHKNHTFNIDFTLHFHFVFPGAIQFQGCRIIAQKLFDFFRAFHISSTFDSILNWRRNATSAMRHHGKNSLITYIVFWYKHHLEPAWAAVIVAWQ